MERSGRLELDRFIAGDSRYSQRNSGYGRDRLGPPAEGVRNEPAGLRSARSGSG